MKIEQVLHRTRILSLSWFFKCVTRKPFRLRGHISVSNYQKHVHRMQTCKHMESVMGMSMFGECHLNSCINNKRCLIFIFENLTGTLGLKEFSMFSLVFIGA